MKWGKLYDPKGGVGGGCAYPDQLCPRELCCAGCTSVRLALERALEKLIDHCGFMETNFMRGF